MFISSLLNCIRKYTRFSKNWLRKERLNNPELGREIYI